MGWAGVQNGKLLALAAEHGFDAVLSKDSGIEYQQSLKDLPVAVVLLRAEFNAIEDLLPLVPSLLAALSTLVPRTLVRVG